MKGKTLADVILVGSLALGLPTEGKAASYYNGHLYSLTPNSGTCNEAETDAVELGGYLVTINNEAEQLWLNNTFPRDTAQRVDEELWIGLYQLPGSVEPDQGWEWTSGDPVTYTNWHSGEPNEGAPPETNEDRALMHGFQTGHWIDVPNDYGNGFYGIVEIPGWYEYNGHWYGLIPTATSWEEAEAYAEGLGGTLVNIEDEAEQIWLNNTFPRDTADRVDEELWIGLWQDTSDPSYSEPGGGWKWICSGGAASYTNWHSGEPNEGPPPETNEDRVLMHGFQTGHWIDVPGNYGNGFYGIVEIVPEPTTLSLLALGGFAVMSRRRR